MTTVALPVFYLEFRVRNGRDPLPSEMTAHERRLLRKAATRNRDLAQQRRDAGIDELCEAFRRLDISDPTCFHDIVEAMHEPQRSDFLRLTMKETPERVLELAQQYFTLQDTDVERWERLLLESVGVRSV